MRQTDSEYLHQTADALGNIAAQIEGLIVEAGRLLRQDPVTFEIWQGIRGQWYSSIVSSIHPHSEWVGGPMAKMTHTIRLLQEMADEMDVMDSEPDFFDELNNFEELTEVE